MPREAASGPSRAPRDRPEGPRAGRSGFMGPIIVRAIIFRGPAAWGQLGLAHSAWQSGFGYTRLNVGLRRRHFGTTVLSVGRNDCAKGRFGLRGLSDQHVARRRLKVGVVTAAVNMMTFGSARMSRQRRVHSNHQLRTSQAKRRVADVVVVMLSHHKTTLSLNARK